MTKLCIKALNLRPDVLSLLQEKVGGGIQSTACGQEFSEQDLDSSGIKTIN